MFAERIQCAEENSEGVMVGDKYHDWISLYADGYETAYY
jgi:hypothetical protein